MKTKEIYLTLCNLCRWEMPSEVKELLIENSHDIDIIHDDGHFLRLALSAETTELLHVLLDYYYDQHGLRVEPETYNTEQMQAKSKLFKILQDAVISEEMQKTLEGYGLYPNCDNSSTYSQEEFVEHFEFEEHDNYDVNLIDTRPIRKLHSMDDIKDYSKISNFAHGNSEEEPLTIERLKEWELAQLKNNLPTKHGIDQHHYECHSMGESYESTDG